VTLTGPPTHHASAPPGPRGFRWKTGVMADWSQKKAVSNEKAPASLNSSLISTQNSRCGSALEYGAGRGTHVRSRISRPAGGGKSAALLLPAAGFLSRPKSSSSGARRAVWEGEGRRHVTHQVCMYTCSRIHQLEVNSFHDEELKVSKSPRDVRRSQDRRRPCEL